MPLFLNLQGPRKGGSSRHVQAQAPPPRNSRPPYTPRCVCDTIFPQAVVAGPGSKPRVCRYIQRCSFSKAVTQDKLIFAVRQCPRTGRKQRPKRLRGPSSSFPKGSLKSGSQRRQHCHRLHLSSPEPFRLYWP